MSGQESRGSDGDYQADERQVWRGSAGEYHALLQDLPNPGTKPESVMSPALVGGSLPIMPPGKPKLVHESPSDRPQ